MKNLKAILSFLILLSVVLPVLLSTLISSYLIESNSKQQIRQRFISEVGHIERHITSTFNQVEARVGFLANSAIVRRAMGQLPSYLDKSNITPASIGFDAPIQRQAYQQFNDIATSMENITYVYLGDNSGGYLQWPIGPLPDNYNPTQRPWYSTGLAGQGDFIRPSAYYWETDDTVVISTVKAIRADDGTSGVLGIDISLAQLDTILKNVNLGFGERFLLIESGGTVLADTRNSENQFSNFSDILTSTSINELSNLSHTGGAEMEINGALSWVSKFEFSQLGWSFYVIVPNKALVQQSKQINAYTVPIALVCIAIFCLIGYVIAAKITKRIHLREHQLTEAKEHAELAVVAKSQFLATISHEIRTPLNGVLGMTQLLAKTPMSEQQKNKVDTILLSGNRLMHLINEVLDFSKVEANELVLAPHRVNLAQVLSNLALSFKANASEQKIDLVVDLHDLEHVIVEVDDLRLGQVVGNLLSNAIKFTEQGYVSVKATVSDENRLLTVEVTDTGIGLSPEQQRIIFDEFKQADSSTTRKYGGTGLGLALSSAIVELMGGELQVKSALEQGSTFYFSVPVNIEESNEEIPDSTRQQWSGLKVMALDDIQQNLDVLSAIISDLGATIDCFTDPMLALEKVTDGHAYDIIIVDYMMPDIDGLTWIQRAQPAPDALRILFTSVDDLNTIQKAKPYFDKVIHKPALERDIVCLTEAKTTAHLREQPVSSQLQGDVLVVEDNDINYMIIDALLTEIGLNVTWAKDGEQALRKYDQRSFDVILMDCMLPGIDGYEAAESIRASNKPDSATIPIIALTADTTKDNESKCYRAGMNDYVTKPLNLETVQSVLRRYLRVAKR